MRLPKVLSSLNRPVPHKLRALLKRPARPQPLRLEALEQRALLTSFTPIQIRHAYGFDRVGFEDSTHSLVAGDGQGMTIAVIDAYDDPNIYGDLAVFDSAYGLPAPPNFNKLNQTGGTIFPSANAGWAGEIALDVEYAHAMAPGADILLVEANSTSNSDLDAAVRYAANHGAAVISMSFSGSEYANETFEDPVFTHAGVTYLAATGDYGAPGGYPAFSPNVVAVGGTALSLNSDGSYNSESGWGHGNKSSSLGGSGGGISQDERQPAYQKGVVTQSTTNRAIPDVSFDADPNTGVLVYDTFGGHGSYIVGGTSASTPIMAGLAAIVDQGRSYLFGRSPYSSAIKFSQPNFLNALYHLPQSDLNDIVTGNNGFAAGPGYDLVTGRGSPIVDRFVSGMIGAPVYDRIDGSLLVTGGGEGSNDTITLSESGGQLTIEISASTPLAGSGIPADQTFTFDSGQYSAVTLATGDGTTTINVDDSADNASSNAILASSTLTGLPMGTIYFGTGSIRVLNITGSNGNNNYTITGTPASQGTTLFTGGGVDTVYVQGTAFPLTINSASGSGADVINLGDRSNTLMGIQAGVTVNAAPTDSLVLNDQGFGASRIFTVTDTSIAWGGPAVTYAGLGSVMINGGTGGNTFDVLATSATAALTLIGGGSGDTLGGSNAGNTFTIFGSNAGILSGSAYGSNVAFSQVGNLLAGSGGDTFRFADGASLTGNIVGGGSDTLDYSAYSTSVIVDLQTGFATGVSGSVSGITTIFGGSGTPAASGVFNLLVGNGGNTLTGGFGRRNILVAGASASTLNGGNGEDLLIGGNTAYDTEAGLNTWQQIAAYWAGSDDYATRVANLLSSSGVPLLDASVVIGNGGNNTLTGNGALALLYTDGLDALSGFDPGSQQVTITP
jgi:hypothetical protein